MGVPTAPESGGLKADGLLSKQRCRIAILLQGGVRVGTRSQVNDIQLDRFAGPQFSAEESLMGRKCRSAAEHAKFGTNFRTRLKGGQVAESQSARRFAVGQGQDTGAGVGLFFFGAYVFT